jgi:hypothetical protein
MMTKKNTLRFYFLTPAALKPLRTPSFSGITFGNQYNLNAIVEKGRLESLSRPPRDPWPALLLEVKTMEVRMFFALPDLRELSLGKPQGLRARDEPATTNVNVHPVFSTQTPFAVTYNCGILGLKLRALLFFTFLSFVTSFAKQGSSNPDNR